MKKNIYTYNYTHKDKYISSIVLWNSIMYVPVFQGNVDAFIQSDLLFRLYIMCVPWGLNQQTQCSTTEPQEH